MVELKLDNVTVDHPVYNLTSSSLKRYVVNAVTGGKVYTHEINIPFVRALDDISLHLKEGDKLGIIGHNGAGKSTLLRTMAGIYHPTGGTIQRRGHVTPLFGVGAGMDFEKSGIENIFLVATLYGVSKEEIESIIPQIIEFSELGEFIAMPIRTYSDGMRVRLGFSILTALNPEILLLDEAIGAGDEGFIQKALVKAKEFYQRARILVLASHSHQIIKEACTHFIEMQKGKIVRRGLVEEL